MSVNRAMAVILAVLFPLGTNGQNQEKKLPPLLAKCQAANKDFVKGQNVEVKCDFFFKNGVNLNLEDLKKINDRDFTVIEFSATDPVPAPNQKDYNIISATEILKPDIDLKYGKYSIGLSLEYDYPEIAWQSGENNKGKNLTLRVANKVENFPPIIFEKVPLIARLDGGEGFKDVVNIGEHIQYTLRVFYEKGAVILLNNLNAIELDKKYGVKDATRLENPILRPFAVVNKDDSKKIEERDQGDYKEIVCRYVLALYEVSLTKMFEIPPMHIYYIGKGKSEITKLSMPAIRVRTNSVLNRDSNFRPMKEMRKPNLEKLKQRGLRPLWTAYIATFAAGLIILCSILAFIARHIKKIYNAGLRASLCAIRKSLSAKINRLPFVAKTKTINTLAELKIRPSQENLKAFIRKLRLYMGIKAKINENFALSRTMEEFCLLGIDPETLGNAEYLLDEEIERSDVEVLQKNLKKLINTRR